MTLAEARNALAFSDDWFNLGIVTPERIDQFALELLSGDDPNPEHYRWRAFSDFLKANRPLSHELAWAL
jgi:hypothetical protein